MGAFEKRALFLMALNLWDLTATYYYVVLRKMEELNPIMEYLIHFDPKLFIIYKIATMAAIVVLTEYSFKTKTAYLIYLIITGFYLGVGILHFLFAFKF